MRSQILYDVGDTINYVYFPNQAMISVVSIMQNGAIIEVAVIGCEGMVGMPICWADNIASWQTMVQIPGNAMRISAHVLKTEFERGGALQKLLLRYTNALFAHVAQSVACNRLHTLEQRLARWLLIVDDRIKSDEIPLTHEFLSYMLGTRRSGVTEAINNLSQAGIIRCTRGKIMILSRERLELASCECYAVIRTELYRLLGKESR